MGEEIPQMRAKININILCCYGDKIERAICYSKDIQFCKMIKKVLLWVESFGFKD